MMIRARKLAAAAAWIVLGCGGAIAQSAPQNAAPATAGTTPATASSQPAPDLRALSDALNALQAQVQALTSQINDLRMEEKNAREEARELRAELDQTKAQLASKMKEGEVVAASATPASAESPTASSSTQAAPVATDGAAIQSADSVDTQPQKQNVAERLDRLEENQQVEDGKITDQYQTKVESSSKYRVRLTGIALLNVYGYRGQVDNADFPAIAAPPDPLGATGSFGGSLRQSRIGLEVFGPDVWGAHTSANIQFDFAGGFAQTENGNTMGLIRLRTGTIRFDWANTSVIAGQDYLFFAPLQPTSLAQFAVPALSYTGNLWAWTPQVRVEHRFMLGHGQKISLSGGILDSQTGDFPGIGVDLYPSWGEQSNQPGYAARVAWSMPAFDKQLTLGFGVYYGRQFWGFGRYVNGWVATSDLTLPLGKRFEFSGEFYRGNAVGGFGGAIGQTVLISGDFGDMATEVDGLDSMGGWVQLKYRATPKLEFNAAFGDDSPFSHELRQYSSTPPTYNALLTKNIGPFANFIYNVKSNVMFSLEYRYLKTFSLDSGSNSAHHLNLAIGYVF